VPLIQSYTLG